MMVVWIFFLTFLDHSQRKETWQVIDYFLLLDNFGFLRQSISSAFEVEVFYVADLLLPFL